MVTFEKLVGKYVRVSQKYIAYFFPKQTKSRLRDDDQEMVYWDEYMMLGAGYYHESLCLFYDPLAVSYQTQQLAKARNFKVENKRSWQREMIWTVLQPNFQGVLGEAGFWEALKKIQG